MRLHGTALSEQVFDLLRKRTSAGQILTSFAVLMNNFDTSFKDNIVVFHHIAPYLRSEIKER